MDALSRAVVEAVDRAPGSERALARAAGVSHTTLQKIRAGKLRATSDVAAAVAEALDRMAADCQRAAESIRNASQGER